MMMKIFFKFIFSISAIFAGVVLLLFIALSIHDSPVYAWRIITMLQSDTGDINHFPTRSIDNGPVVSNLPIEILPIPKLVKFQYKGSERTESLQDLILRTDTTAFVVIRDDKIIHQEYPEGKYEQVNTSFSVAKSFDSALIGAAIQDGFIDSENDLVIKYVPEIKGRGLHDLRIHNLLRMDSGIRYFSADDRLFIFEPLSDDALTYYPPDLRKIALSVQASITPIGATFKYNNFHPLLEGLIIERVTGMPVAEYLQEKIWKPMGAEFPASWSLDSEKSGFEKMESGINATAVDFARFGLLYLHNGYWNGNQILPEAWVQKSTLPDPNDNRFFEGYPSWPEIGGYYGYHWWGLMNNDGSYDFMARGHLGQIIYVSPEKNMVVVRLGSEPDSNLLWFNVIRSLINQMP
ncbi:MAG: serine hydrolase [Anaerolineaceae bacterium]|nr:serine hydrolase [Anaerolineaceae bacterium]